MKLSTAHLDTHATVEIVGDEGILFRETWNLAGGVFKTFDLSQVAVGTYRIEVRVGKQLIMKVIQIEQPQARTVRLG